MYFYLLFIELYLVIIFVIKKIGVFAMLISNTEVETEEKRGLWRDTLFAPFSCP